MELPVAVALFAVVVAAAIWFLTNRAKPDAEAGAELQTEPETGQSARRPSASEMREARRLQRANRADDGDEAQDENEDEPHPAAAASSAGKKKKSANQAAKRELREYRDASRTAKEEKLESRKDKQALRDEEREAREAEKEEAEAKLLAEKKEQEQEEYDSWKDMFSTDAAGSVEEEIAEESQGLLQEFVDYIKSHKVVVLEDLASNFGLRVEEAVNRVRGLEQMGYITGVVDDRGKFIYISEEEMETVATFIKKKGRITIADLCAQSNSLIKLTDETKDE